MTLLQLNGTVRKFLIKLQLLIIDICHETFRSLFSKFDVTKFLHSSLNKFSLFTRACIFTLCLWSILIFFNYVNTVARKLIRKFSCKMSLNVLKRKFRRGKCTDACILFFSFFFNLFRRFNTFEGIKNDFLGAHSIYITSKWAAKNEGVYLDAGTRTCSFIKAFP